MLFSHKLGLLSLALALAGCANGEASTGQTAPGAGGSSTASGGKSGIDAAPASGGSVAAGGAPSSGGTESGGSAGAAGAPVQDECEVVETFERTTFPELPWMWGGSKSQALGPQAAHDGQKGILESEWSINQFVKIGKPGDRLRAWVRGNGGGRAYLGFGTTPLSTKALVFATNANSLLLNDCPTLYEFNDVAQAQFGLSVGSWYQLVVEFGQGGQVTGHLYEADGKKEAATVSYTFPGLEPAGIAIRAFGSTYIDTLEVCRAE